MKLQFTILATLAVLSCVFSEDADSYLSQGVKTGDGTFYTEWSSGTTSCGHTKLGKLCALSKDYMDKLASGAAVTNPNTQPLCSSIGKVCVIVWDAAKGDTPPSNPLELQIDDRCEGCKKDDIDISDDVYEQLFPKAKGRQPVKWKFVKCGSGASAGGSSTSSATSTTPTATSGATTAATPTVGGSGTVPASAAAQPCATGSPTCPKPASGNAPTPPATPPK